MKRKKNVWTIDEILRMREIAYRIFQGDTQRSLRSVAHEIGVSHEAIRKWRNIWSKTREPGVSGSTVTNG